MTKSLYIKLVYLLITIAIILNCTSCQNSSTKRFVIDPTGDNFGVDFSNDVLLKDSQNIIQNLYFFNGGGVSIGDINNDTLPDLYFTSNQGTNKLYLNQGDFQFKDITETAFPNYKDDWSTGVTMADVNNDGWMDIYTSAVNGHKSYTGHNRLWLNQGDLTFKESDQLGLSVFGTQAAFFDYDKDGDLDVYLLCQSFKTPEVYRDTSIRSVRDTMAGDRLFKNQLIESGLLQFEEVTETSGIYSSAVGFGLGVSVSDINGDEWPDIYVSNDFHENDYLYINNQDGTFSEEGSLKLPHGSTFSMGSDIADINNDSRQDIMTLDMKPEDYSIFKNSSGIDAFDVYRYKLGFGYANQYSQNCLFINSDEQFTDISNMAGVAATDWSWSVLLEDYDLDGQKDMFIANGIVRRPNDLDYLNYLSSDIAQNELSDSLLTVAMPTGAWRNYFYKNKGSAAFEDVTTTWSNMSSDVSTGAAVADLDLDGDLDIVSNRINESALVLRNESSVFNYLIVDVDPKLKSGFLGAKVIVKSGDLEIMDEVKSNRGFQSSSEMIAHFGLGSHSSIDSLIVYWPNGDHQLISNVQSNRRLYIQRENNYDVVFEDCSFWKRKQLDIVHKENDFTDLNGQKLMPFSMATKGPALAYGDINNDGIEDIYVGNSSGINDKIYRGKENAFWNEADIANLLHSSFGESVDATFEDVDQDGDLDLYVVSGGNDQQSPSLYHQDKLYMNNGRGEFLLAKERLPVLNRNGSIVRTGDFDNDGDIDLFVGASCKGLQYGVEVPSDVLINNGAGYFTHQSYDLGMVNDADVIDINGDDLLDIVVASEWRDIQILLNNGNGFSKSIIPESAGLWRSIKVEDLNQDGVLDIVAGNIGPNLPFNASNKEPLMLFVGDFNNNGSTEPVLAHYVDGVIRPYETRDNLSSQIPQLKRKFTDYNSFASARLDEVIDISLANKLVANTLASTVFIGKSNLKFTRAELPKEAQYSNIDAIIIEDINHDGYEDIIFGGNLYELAPSIGRLDGSAGGVLMGTSNSTFDWDLCKSNLNLRGQIRKILKTEEGEFLIGFNNSNLQHLSF